MKFLPIRVNFGEFPVPGWQEKNRFFEPLDPRYHDENGEYKAMYIHPSALHRQTSPCVANV